MHAVVGTVADKDFPLTEANSICTQTYQNQSYPIIMLKYRTQWLNSTALSEVFFYNWKWWCDQINT